LLQRREKLEGGVRLEMVSEFQPAGDQPTAIAELSEGVEAGEREQVLLGATGTGKTYTMAKIIEADAAAGDHSGAEQDAGGAALRRVQVIFPE
jgi:predicted helicase